MRPSANRRPPSRGRRRDGRAKKKGRQLIADGLKSREETPKGRRILYRRGRAYSIKFTLQCNMGAMRRHLGRSLWRREAASRGDALLRRDGST